MPRNSESQPKPSIIFEDVSKTFNINHTTSLKETFLAAMRRRNISSKFNAVDHVSFEIPEGQSVAIMGRNGSGKSTTLKLLSGVLRPDTGWIRTRGRIAGLLEVGAGFHPDLTGRQNVYLNAAILGMSKDEIDAKFDDILAFSEIGEFIDTEVKRYSSGMYSRLGFSVAVHTEVDVLLVDEVLSVGDAQFRVKCETRMLELREQGKTMFVVSHAAAQVKKLCERGIVLEKGKVVFDGLIDDAVEYLTPPSTLQNLPFSVPQTILECYEPRRASFGNPLGDAQYVPGGMYQEFERGLITSLDQPGPDGATFALSKNEVLYAIYKRAGGPGGPWGLILESAKGRLAELEPLVLKFQHGHSTYSVDEGFKFVPLESQ